MMLGVARAVDEARFQRIDGLMMEGREEKEYVGWKEANIINRMGE